jgi:hypothetical protein
MAGKRCKKIREREITGLKYFKKLLPLLERLHDDGSCPRQGRQSQAPCGGSLDPEGVPSSMSTPPSAACADCDVTPSKDGRGWADPLAEQAVYFRTPPGVRVVR